MGGRLISCLSGITNVFLVLIVVGLLQGSSGQSHEEDHLIPEVDDDFDTHFDSLLLLRLERDVNDFPANADDLIVSTEYPVVESTQDIVTPTTTTTTLITTIAPQPPTTTTPQPTTSIPTTTTTTIPTTQPATTTITTTTLVDSYTTTTNPDKPSTQQGGDGSALKGRTDSSCKDLNSPQTVFGEYGLIAFVVTLGVAVVLLWALVMVLCMPRCLKRYSGFNRQKEQKAGFGNVGDGAVYRPRPSFKNSQCVPTPLALANIDEIPIVLSNKEGWENGGGDHGEGGGGDGVGDVGGGGGGDVLTTDLDATSDLGLEGGDHVINEFPTVDRKFSTISATDPAKVSTFLLRQTSLRLEEEEKKKKSSLQDTA